MTDEPPWSSAYPEQWHPHFCFSQDKTVIHKVGCVMAWGGTPWQWSSDQPMSACRKLAELAGWKACITCEPFV